MALKLKKQPGLTNRDIVLPSNGYAYRTFPTLIGGQINVRAFNWEIESLMFGTSGDNTAKQYTRLCTLLSRLVDWPKGFQTGDLLEGDSAYIIMTARALTYPEQYHMFTTTCDHCGEKEEHKLKIPEHLPQNLYPQDFRGYVEYTTFNDNVVNLRFLTLSDDTNCLRMSRERAQKNIIADDAVENDYQLNRLCMALESANGEKPANLEEARVFFKSMPTDEREELAQAHRVHAPGINSKLSLRCPHCNEKYETFIPITMEFFRPRSRTIRTELPGGVRIGIPGPDQRLADIDGTGSADNAADLNRHQGGGVESPERSNEAISTIERLKQSAASGTPHQSPLQVKPEMVPIIQPVVIQK